MIQALVQSLMLCFGGYQTNFFDAILLIQKHLFFLKHSWKVTSWNATQTLIFLLTVTNPPFGKKKKEMICLLLSLGLCHNLFSFSMCAAGHWRHTSQRAPRFLCFPLIYLPAISTFHIRIPFWLVHSSCKVLCQMHLLQEMLHQHHSAVESKVHKKERIISCRLKSIFWWLRLVMRANVGNEIYANSALNPGINVRYWQ